MEEGQNSSVFFCLILCSIRIPLGKNISFRKKEREGKGGVAVEGI